MDDSYDARRARRVTIGDMTQLYARSTRRDFVRVMGLGGALVLLPGFVTSCGNDQLTAVGGPGTGTSVVIDFSRGDVALLQFAYVLEQLEAAFYSRIVAGFPGSTFTSIDQSVLTDIRNHEVIHRDFLRGVLGADASFTLTPTFSGLAFSDRAAVLGRAKAFEELGISAYNGFAHYVTSAANLSVFAKIVSVEARHASAVRELLAPRATDFAGPLDAASDPGTVAKDAQNFLVEKLAFANAPASTTAQG